jgi:hypothetical protein
MAQGRKTPIEEVLQPASGFVERDFADVLEEQQENDRLLVDVSANLAAVGKRLFDLGKILEKPEAIPPEFELEELEDLIAKIPALVSRFHELSAASLEIQSRLTNLSWHRS